MKNGIFSFLSALCLGLFSLQLSGCAFLELASEEDDFDRGYAVEEEYSDGGQCRGRACHTDADEESADRTLASEEEDGGSRKVRRAIQTRDVILGMTQRDVMDSWGEPMQREVAGRGNSGHERWTYGSRYSLGNQRTVIFENGRVAGWKQ